MESKITLESAKFSDIDLPFVKDYLRVDYDDDDIELSLYISAARAFILEHSGKTMEQISELDNIGYSPLLIVKLVADMYINKSATVDSNIKEDITFKSLMNNIRNYNLGLRE